MLSYFYFDDVGILSKNNGVDDEMRLQHALLSALRNLVIPKENKKIIIEAGLVGNILPMLKIHQAPVVYKLLGTLRMLIDGQTKLAVELLENTVLITQLISWSTTSECSSVTGESSRLMAWLIKHAYKEAAHDTGTFVKSNPASLRRFCETENAVKAMIVMLSSQHLVMQNEALIALCIISTLCMKDDQSEDDALIATFVANDIGQFIGTFIQRSADTMTKEIVENLQTLIALMRRSPRLVAHLNSNHIDESLNNIPILTEYCTL